MKMTPFWHHFWFSAEHGIQLPGQTESTSSSWEIPTRVSHRLTTATTPIDYRNHTD
jgi:hypothetical protein